MARRASYLAIMIFVLTARLVHPVEYDLAAVVQLALQGNANVLLARADGRLSNADVAAAYSTALPKANVGLSYDRTLRKGLTATTDNTFGATGRIDQTLFRLQVLYAIRAARYAASLTDETILGTERAVIVEAKKSFYRALLLAEVSRVAEETEASARDNYENVRTRFESGVVSEFDLLQAEVSWQNTVPESMRARRDHAISLNNLKALIGLELSESLELSGEVATIPEMPSDVPYAKAASQRSDRRALVWQQKLQDLNVRAQKAARYPTLDASFTYTTVATSDAFALDNDDSSAVLSLLLTVPVSTGGDTNAQIKKAQASFEKAGVRLSQLDDTIRIELSNSRLRMEEATERINAAGKGVETAARTYELAETRVETGLGTQLELQDIRVALSQARVGYYSAIFDFLSAYFDWELASGQVSMEGL